MTAEDLSDLSIAALSQQLRSRALSPIALMQATLQRIADQDHALHSFNTIAADSAMRAARQAETEIAAGRYRSWLHGIPYGAKDIYDSAGILTSCQSRLMRDNVPAHNAAAIQRLQNAGAILVGKCATAEFATGGPSDETLFPPARNPWDIARYPGGSSTGSAVAVAAGFVRMALGSDTGGSIRGPAAFCGTVGLKPTYGLVSRRGVFPLAYTLDHCGPLARSVEDAALTLQVIAGHDPADPTSADVAVPDYLAGLDLGIEGLRIGYLRRWIEEDPQTDSEQLDALDRAAELLRRLGAVVTLVDAPAEEIFLAVGRTILISEFYAIHQRTLLRNPELYGRPARERIAVGAFARAADYIDALRVRRRLAALVDSTLLGPYDALLTSTAVRPAWRFDDMPDEPMHMLGLTTYAFNVTGHPAMSVCCGYNSVGLPLSLQLVGRAFDESTLLRIGAIYQRSTPWLDLRPPSQPQSAANSGTMRASQSS
jgi:aspartyl-tRNA(Asn)/glutamyl-tRNA(Gln) amidotransferase subunit A